LLQEAEREEQIAAARQIPKEVAVQLPDAPPTYLPAPKAQVVDQTAANSNATGSAGNTTAPAQRTPASVTPVSQANVAALQPKELPPAVVNKPEAAPNREANAAQNDSAIPAPKSASLTPLTEQPKTLDLASAIKNIVSPGTNVATSAVS